MRSLLLAGGLVVLGAVVVGCSPPPASCTAATCSGCCDSSGTCQQGDTDLACGASALACQACGAGFSCQSKICARSSTGGGGGTTGGGGGTTGGGGGTTGGGGGTTGGGGGTTGGGGGTTGGGGGTTGGGGGATGGGGGTVNCQAMTPPTIPISFPVTCPFPTPCGGNPAPGTFFYTGACIPQEEFNSVVTRIEGVCGVGSVRINGYDGGLAGYATFSTGNNVCRVVRGGVTVGATITGTCGSSALCGVLGSNLGQGGFTGSCGMDAGSCECLVNRAIDINNQGVAYTVGATTLTVTGSGQTFETCLAGTTFSTRESDAGTATHEPGVATLTKQ